MTFSTSPDSWPDLSTLDLSDSSADARAALLKVNAEMFVAAPVRDRDSIETFEALVLGFLPRMDSATLRELAAILAPCQDTPASILGYLAHHSPDARTLLLGQPTSTALSRMSKLLATPDGRLHLASRPDLDAATARRLLMLEEGFVEDVLAANTALSSVSPIMGILVQRAHIRPSLARILLERRDLSLTDEASLYLSADRHRRECIRARLASAIEHQDIIGSHPLAKEMLRRFGDTALQGDIDGFEALLTEAFGFPASTEWRVLGINRHRLLALALKALNVPEKDAINVLLNLHPALSFPLSAIKELVREMRLASSSVAQALVRAILSVK